MTERQYIMFKLGEGDFGIDIMHVQEISVYQKLTPLPNVPKFMEGILNYRGNVIPVISLRRRFSLEDTNVTKDTRIIVVNLKEKEVGFIVDEAMQTVRLSDDNIDPAPDFSSNIKEKYIRGVGKLDNKSLLSLIDIEKVLSKEDMNSIEEAKDKKNESL